eukprot:TRINITY_DN3056_c0_g1_i1.p2 TRINITY_DN3056_c0_g1~~TRINITY_DN3056_c0_g1_i1.p2  ORF type:complete len:150 (-),score=57.14 TRINITY_DN3056_c0_g1_i1:70-519(-)
MTEEEAVGMIKAMFARVDANKDGRITFAEFIDFERSEAAADGAPALSELELKIIMSIMDKDKSGTIEEDEFISFWHRDNIARNNAEVARRLFEMFDADHNGKLDQAEVANLLRLTGKPYDEAAVMAMFAACDLDNDGMIALPEFLASTT